jgi:hemolysin activation/secretion protein
VNTAFKQIMGILLGSLALISAAFAQTETYNLKQDKIIQNFPSPEPDNFYMRIGVNNHNSPMFGAYRKEAEVRYKNLTGLGDMIRAEYALSEGLDDYLLDYRIPVTPWHTSLRFFFERKEAVITEEPFDKLDIANDMYWYNVNIIQPVIKDSGTEIGFAIAYEKMKSETRLLGESFSFPSSGADEETGILELEIWRLIQYWVKRQRDQFFAAESWIDLNEHYTRWLVQTRFMTRFRSTQIHLKCDFQLTDRRPPSSERFPIGGDDTVRGYRKYSLMTDSGVVLSGEWHLPLGGPFRLVTFFDWGRGYNSGKDPDLNTLSAFGTGLIFDYWKLHGKFYWGIPLKNLDYDQWDLQNDGVYFEFFVDLL